MSETRNIGRSIRAVLAGFVAGVVLSLGTDAVLHAVGVFPRLGRSMSDGLFLLATAYRIPYAVAGSYIMAWLAPDRPMLHALVGGVVGLVLSLVGRPRDVEPGARAALVSVGAGRHRAAVRLGGRQTPHPAVAR